MNKARQAAFIENVIKTDFDLGGPSSSFSCHGSKTSATKLFGRNKLERLTVANIFCPCLIFVASARKVIRQIGTLMRQAGRLLPSPRILKYIQTL
jgi:hypothetical protein